MLDSVESFNEWSKRQRKSFDATLRLCKDIAPERFIVGWVHYMNDVIIHLKNNDFIKYNYK